MLDVLSAPEGGQELERLVQPGGDVVRRRALAERDRVARLAQPDAEDEAPAGEVVERRHLLRQLPGAAPCERRDERAEAEPVGRERDRRQRDGRVREILLRVRPRD
jgi:hypothetical protein